MADSTNFQIMMTLPEHEAEAFQQQLHNVFGAIHERVRRGDFINGKWATILHHGADVGRFKVESTAETRADIERANAAQLRKR